MDKYDRLQMAKKAARLNNEDLGKFLGITSSGVAVAFSRKNLSDLKINILIEKMRLNPNWLETGEGDMFLTNMVFDPPGAYGKPQGDLFPELEAYKKSSVDTLAAALEHATKTLELQANTIRTTSELLNKQSEIQERYIKLLEELRGK
jgi:hypothetical protein